MERLVLQFDLVVCNKDWTAKKSKYELTCWELASSKQASFVLVLQFDLVVCNKDWTAKKSKYELTCRELASSKQASFVPLPPAAIKFCDISVPYVAPYKRQGYPIVIHTNCCDLSPPSSMSIMLNDFIVAIAKQEYITNHHKLSSRKWPSQEYVMFWNLIRYCQTLN